MIKKQGKKLFLTVLVLSMISSWEKLSNKEGMIDYLKGNRDNYRHKII